MCSRSRQEATVEQIQVGSHEQSREGRVVSAKHIAWFSFKEGVTHDRIEEHMEAVRGLADLVPAVDQIECGPSYSDRAGGLTHCIIVSLPRRDALSEYLEHSAHVPVADALVGDVDMLLVMDLDLS